MKEAIVLEYTVKAIFLVLLLSVPPILLATLTGLVVSLFQALTQVQEQTLSFGVKLVVVIITLLLTAAWIGGELVNFTLYIMQTFPYLAR